jgi:ADP-heptose:LPS heptosyltransferase
MARSSTLQRSLDRIVGAPAIKALSVGRKRRAIPQEPKRIGVIQPTAIGDAILSSGVVARIAKTFPTAELWVLHGASNGAAVAMIDAPFQREVMAFSRPDKAAASLRAKRFDLLIDLTPWPRATALAARLSGAVTVGFDSEGQARGAAFDVAVPHRCDRHEIENLAAMAEAVAGAAPYAMAVKRGWPAPALDLAFDRLVLAHPCPGGSQAAAKTWPAAYWVELVGALNRAGYIVGFTGTKADTAAVDGILQAGGFTAVQAFSLCGRLTLPELAGAIERARATVSVDTGVMHLAAALGAPLVALHGPTLPARWGPVSPNATALLADHPAAGYIQFGYETHPEADALMAALPPHLVLAAVEARLAEPLRAV